MFKPLRIPRKVDPNAREDSFRRIAQFKAATVELERVCKEQGIPVPVLVC